MKAHHGFSLIELMVVVTLIGIISAISISAYSDYITRAQITEAITQMDNLKQKIQFFFQENGSCINNTTVETGDIADQNGIAAQDDYQAQYISGIQTGGTATTDGGCTVTGKFKNTGVNASIKNKQIVYTLHQFTSMTPQWTCHTPDIATNDYMLLPVNCRFPTFDAAKAH